METNERGRRTQPAALFIGLVLVFVLAGAALGVLGAVEENPLAAGVGLYLWIKAAVTARGLFIVNPNESKVLVLFGNYKGTVRASGLHWANRCTSVIP